MLEFKKLELSNFMSFGHAWLEFPRGLVLIEGICEGSSITDSNAAGKTAIFDAIAWVIWAKTLRGLTYDEIINERRPKGDTYVKLWLNHEGSPLQVSRYRGHKEHKNDLVLEINGGDYITGKAAQEYLESVVGVSFNIFINSMMFGQGLSRFGEMADNERKRLLEDMLDLGILSKVLKVTKSMLKDVQGDLDEGNLQKDITKEKVGHVKESLSLYRDSSGTFESDRSRRRKKAAKELSSSKKEEDTFRMKLERQGSELDTLHKVSAKLDDVIALSNEEYSKLQERNEKLIILGSRRDKAKVKVDQLLEQTESLEELKPGAKCPTCLQTVTKKHQESCLGTVWNDFESADKKAKGLSRKYNKQFQEYSEEFEDWRGSSGKLSGKKKELDGKVDLRERRITELNVELKAQRRVVSEKTKAVKIIDAEKNPYRDLIRKGKTELETLRKKLKKFTRESNRMSKQLKLLKFWEYGFGIEGLRSYILDSICPMLNAFANECAMDLTGGALCVEFYTKEPLKTKDKYAERFGFNVISTEGSQHYKACSSGEKRRIDLIILLAFQNLLSAVSGFHSSVVFYDEVFDHLDSTGREFVLNMLQKESEHRSTIFVITQEVALRERFPQVVTVVKEKGISDIKEASYEEEEE